MKSKRLLLLLLLAIGLPWAANAQTVTIGTGTSAQNSAPIANYYNYSMAEMIFTADEIGTIDVNTILSLGFQCKSNVSKNYGVTVYMKNISASAFTATTDFITLSASDVVFTGTVSPTSGWTTIDLPSPFTYDRTGNLLIAVNKTSGGYDGSTAIWNYTSTSTTYKMLYGQNDSSPGVYDPTTTLSLSLNYNRPNVQLVFGTPPSTPKPTGLTVSGITHNEATLSWTENGTATSWQYCLNGDEDHPVTMNTNPYTLTGLTTLTSYTVKVRSVGTGEYSDWSNEQSFSTAAQATAVGDAWSDDFEGTSCGWELINGTQTNKWCWGTAANNGGTHGLYVSNDNGTNNAYSNTTSTVFATKLLGFTEGKFEFSYDWICNGESTFDYLRMALVPASVTLTAGTMPSGFSSSALPSGWIALDGGSKLNLVTAWQSKSLAINVTAGNYYLVMAWRNDGSGGTQPPAAVDNVNITKIACDYDVEDLAQSGIPTTNTATITWTAGEATQWQVAIKAGSGEWVTLSGTYNTNSANLTGLTPSTTYQVRVRAYCDAEHQGSWCSPISFDTQCEIVNAIGFSEDFDSYTGEGNYTASSRVLPNCWNYINGCTNSSYKYYPTVSSYSPSSYANSTPNYLKFYSYYSSWSDYDPQDQYAILPEMDDLSGVQISLMAKGSTFKVGTMSDPTDASTFVEITNSANPSVSSSTFQEFTYIIPANTTAKHLAIMMEAANSSTSSKGVYIDDIVISEAPSCFQPQSLTAATNSLAAHGVTLTWTPNVNGNETAWVLQIATKNDFTENLRSFDVNTTPSKAITELTDGTQYFARVKPDCDTEGTLWSTTYTFTTPIACPAPTGLTVSNTTGSQTTLNWTGNSDSYDVMYRTAAYVDGVYEEFDASGVPSGWTRYSGLVDAVIAGTATLSTVSGYWNTNTNALGTYNMALNIYGTSCKYWLVTPEFNLSQNLSFDLALTDYNNADPIEDNTVQADDRFVVLIYADEEWHILREWNNTGSEYVYNTISSTGENVAINLSAYQGKDVKIAFYGESTNPSTMQNTGGDNHLHIDNVHCGIPYEAGQWITHNQQPVNDTTYILNSLNPETDYDVKVLSNCANETSHETAAVSFTTEAACMVPNTVAYTNVTAHTVQLSWNSDASAWEICLNGNEEHPIAANTNPFGLTGLNEETAYTAKVRANCDGSYSDWSSEVSFTTPLACPAPTGLAVSGTTGHQTTLTWTGESDSYEVYYGEVMTLVAADFNTGDFSQANFTNSTTNPWTVVDKVAKSAGGFSSTQSDLTLEVTGPGIVQFRAKVSSESGYDFGRFLINGTQKVEVSGAGSWIDYEFELAAGSNTLVWRYYKDGSGNYNDDCFYVDDINIFDPEITWDMHGTTEELTYTLDGLDPETNYQVKVKSVCSNETGHETGAVSFTTDVACSAPYNVAVSSVLPTSANLSWTGESDSYVVMYGEIESIVNADFEDNQIPANFTNSTGSLAWTVVENNHSGAYCAKSASGQNSQTSALELGVNLTVDMTLSFSAKVSSESGYDEAYFSIDGTDKINAISGAGEWIDYEYPLAAGQHTLRWYYTKDGSVASNDDCFYVDDIVISAVTSWSESNSVNTTSYTFEGTTALTPSTSYQAKVKAVCDGTDGEISASIAFTTLPDEPVAINGGNWNANSTWEDGQVPPQGENVIISGEVIIPSDYVAVADEITIADGGSITIQEGGQLIHSNEVPVTMSFTIPGYASKDKDNNGYILFTLPLDNDNNVNTYTTPVAATNMNTGTFDLYSFDQNYEEAEWRNFKETSFPFEIGKGYLYANAGTVSPTLSGTAISTNDYEAELVRIDSKPFKGMNLVGNPFTCNAYIADGRQFYHIEGNQVVATSGVIAPFQGVFVYAEANEEPMTFTITEPTNNDSKLVLNLNNGNSLIDRAIVKFSEGRQLPKFQLRQNSTKVYIPLEGKDYAVVRSEGMGTLPVNFKAENNGSYTLSFTSEEVSFAYLHLIDNMTGTETDLLANPSYSFEARTTDYESRFKLVFATGNNANDDAFAFYSNGSFVINNEGNATLQVIDVNGRILKSESINGCANVNVKAAAGVYVLRLVNGNDVKVQKVVVK